MVPKLHAKGKSFAGAARYLLHDKDHASTAERVEWVETLNLATDNPQAAWRVMAATAMDQARLKAEAGVKNTGRKSKDSVLHLTLSWHPDESADLSPQEMRRAAQGALSAIGARDRQAMLVCHNDEPQAHLHILVNRVSAEDGRMLSSSKEKLKLSKWAEKYEKERGQVYCEERVLNNQARERGEYTRGEKDQARNVYEQQAGNDNVVDKKAVQNQQRRKDAALAERSRKMQERHKREARKLETDYKARIVEITTATKVVILKDQKAVREAYRKPWTEQHHEHQAQMAQFEKREKTLLGKVQNAYKALDIPARVGRKTEGQDAAALGDMFDAISSSGGRKEALKRQHERDNVALQKKQRQDEVRAAEAQKIKQKGRLKENRQRFVAERMQYNIARDMDGAKMRAEWRQRGEERKEVWKGDDRMPGPAPEKKDQVDISAENAAQMARNAQRLAAFNEMKRGNEIDRDQGQEY